MKRFLKNKIVLVTAIIVCLLSIGWCVYDFGFEPIISLVTALTTIITSLTLRTREVKSESNISMTNIYNQITTIINNTSNEVKSLRLDLSKGFLNTLPTIKHNTYLEAQPLWDSGVTSNMIEGNNIVLTKLIQLYFDLLDLTEEEGFRKESYKKQIHTYIQYVNDAQPKDRGSMHLVMKGGTLNSIIDDCIVSVVKNNTDKSFFKKWKTQWNDYKGD